MIARNELQSFAVPDVWWLRRFLVAGFLLIIGSSFVSAQEDERPPVPRRLYRPEVLKQIEEEERIAAEEDDEGQPPPVRQTAVVDGEDPVVETPEEQPRVIGNGFGNMGRVGHLGGKTFGRDESITPLEFMPYILTNEHFMFADFRGFITNQSRAGGNFGLGYRRLMYDRNAWVGASLWYDADQSTSKMFQQIGLSFEGLVQQWEFRGNAYFPVTSSQTLNNSIATGSIVGHQLLYRNTSDIGTGLQGVDGEVGYSWPVMDKHVVRAYAGGYHFDGGPSGGVNGFKARVEGTINYAVTVQGLYTHDKLYGDNFMVGLSMQFPFGKDHPTTGWNRSTPSPFRFVERNYNVIVDHSQWSSGTQVAINPATGLPYVVEQVYAPAGGGGGGTADGTSANPFASIAAAQAAGGDLIYVQSGSVITTPINLTAGQHLLGQSNTLETVAIPGGQVRMPTLLEAAQQPGSGGTPIIQNIAGDAITLASNTEVAGFTISSGTGNGIFGNGVSGVSLHDLTFSSIGGDAIHLTNSSGSVQIANIQVNSATGNGIVIDGGNANLSFLGGGSTISAQGDGFVLKNLTGGKVALAGLSLKNVGGNGLLIDKAATDVTVDSLFATQTGLNGTGAAIAITGNTASGSVFNTYNFTGNTVITAPNATGLSANATDAIVVMNNLNVTTTSSSPAISLANTTSLIGFEKLGVNSQGGTGLLADHASDLEIHNGTFVAVNGPAIDISNSAVESRLTSVSVNGGAFGIRLQSSTGDFVVQGSGGYGSGGLIQNTTTAGMIVNGFGNTVLTSMDFTNNAAGIQSKGSTELSMTNLRMTGSTGYAVDSLNDQIVVLSTSAFSSNGAVGGGTIRLQADTVATYTYIVNNNNITDTNGNAIQMLTQAGAAGATLDTQITSNSIAGHHDGSTMIGVNWNGPMVAVVANNGLTAYGPNMTGISIQDSSTTAAIAQTLSTNSILFSTAAATNGTGIFIGKGQSGQGATGSLTLSSTSNTIEFQGTGGIGMRYNLFGPSSDAITSNTIGDFAGGATGMLFDNAGAGSTMIITANTIGLKLGDTTTHRGIIFSHVDPTMVLETPTGASSNWIYNAATVADGFSIPAGKATGGILINGNFVVPP